MQTDNSESNIPRNLLAPAFLIGTVLCVVLIMLLVTLTSDSDEPAAVTTSPSPSSVEQPLVDVPAPVPAPVSEPAAGSRMERCASAMAALQGPLQAARPALEQWQVHVDAMNSLVVGEITLQQATDFWNQTRVGAQRRVERFRNAMASLRRQGVDCPAPILMAPATPDLRPCARHVDAQTRALEAARTSITTWDKHVQEMDMLRLGLLSPEDATAMWLSMWKRGARELESYRQAAQDPRLRDGCAGHASSGMTH